MKNKKAIIQLLMIYGPVFALAFAGFYFEGNEPSDIILMLIFVAIITSVLVWWVNVVVNKFGD